MRRSRYKKKRYYGKGAKGLIRPTLNKGKVFVGEGLSKKHYKKRKKVYGRGAPIGPLLLATIVPKLLKAML